MRKIISEGYAIFKVFRYIVIRRQRFRPKVQNLLLSDDGLIAIGKQIKNNKTLCILQSVFFVLFQSSKGGVQRQLKNDHAVLFNH